MQNRKNMSDRFIENPGVESLRKTRTKVLRGLPATGDDIYFAGCEAAYRQPEMAKATVEDRLHMKRK